MKKLIGVLVLGLMLSMAVHADQFDDALEVYSKGNYQQAYQLFLPIAQKGNADSQYWVGLMYESGQGVRQDYKQAIYWYRISARNGNKDAQSLLAHFYYYGRHILQDYKQAFYWNKRAAEQGKISAQISLAEMYEEGKGAPKDNLRAHMWFNLAAANGYSDASKSRDDLAEIMTTSQIEKAQELARECQARNYKICD